jgi:hypothetical protein
VRRRTSPPLSSSLSCLFRSLVPPSTLSTWCVHRSHHPPSTTPSRGGWPPPSPFAFPVAAAPCAGNIGLSKYIRGGAKVEAGRARGSECLVHTVGMRTTPLNPVESGSVTVDGVDDERGALLAERQARAPPLSRHALQQPVPVPVATPGEAHGYIAATWRSHRWSRRP